MSRTLLCTDLDRTLLPNGQAVESSGARALFNKITQHPDIILAYVTGRNYKLVKQAIDEYAIAQPQYVIADVGSSVYQVVDGKWYYQLDWMQNLQKDWGFADNIFARLQELSRILERIESIRLQPLEHQSAYKLSYFVEACESKNKTLSEVTSALEQHGVISNVIYSIDEQKQMGLLDILPASAGKRQAIKYIMKKLDISVKDMVFAGDSGNDLCVINSELQSVVVANAEQDLINELKKNINEKGCGGELYFAQGNFMGMNGNYAAGIVEGLVHFKPQFKHWLGEGA